MFKRIVAILGFVCLMLSLGGCKLSLKDTVEGKDTDLPALNFDSTLICQVASVNGNLYTLTVLEGNNNYNADDKIYITYDGDQAVTAGDFITFSYNYVKDVSSIDGTPHIAVSEPTLLPEYTPPEATVDTTDEAVE